jgi:hypothetical protein
MRRRFAARSRLTKVAVCAAAFAALGGVAYAAETSPFIGPRGNINTCLPPGGGVAHFWKPGHSCSGGYVGLAIPTNDAGATGPAGATGATGATNSNATAVNGQTPTDLSLREPTPTTGTSSATLYSQDGLTIVADCATSGSASVVADGPASADSELTVSGYASAAAFGSQTDTLGPSSNAVLGASGSGESSFSYENSSGQVITGTIGYQAVTSFASYAGCAFFGDVSAG